MRSLIYILFAWLFALTIITGVQHSQVQQSRSQARQDTKAIWHAVVCSIESAELKNPRLTPAKRTQIVQFWTELLVEQVGTTPCATH